MKNKNNHTKQAGIITSTLITGLIAGFTAEDIQANELYYYDQMGSGATVRSELIDMNLVQDAVIPVNTYEAKFEEAKCGEGKCGEEAKKDGKEKKADASKTKTDAKADAKTDAKADAKTDAKTDAKSKTAESKCGEGKCGE